MAKTSIGRFRFDAALGLLSDEAGSIDLGRRGTALLARLLERRGEVVSKQDLVDAAWPGMAIEESNLSVQVARLRKLIGPAAIETIGRIGYRFVDVATPAAATAVPVVGVPQFAGLDRGGETLARGITDDVRIALSRFRTLAVSSTVLTDGYVLSGSVRADARRLRIAAQLIDGAGRVLWGERFDAGSGYPAGATDRLVDALVAQAEWQVQRAEIERVVRGAPQETAYDLYKRGQARLLMRLPGDNAAAIALFDRALVLDPRNVTIMAAACDARAVRLSMGWADTGTGDVARCRDLAQSGLALRADDPVAASMFGYGLFRGGELDRGLAVIARATAQNDNSVPALALAGTAEMHWGRISAAERHYRRAMKLAPSDPNQAQVMGGVSRIRMMQERYSDALDWATRALEINVNYSGARWTQVAANAKLGRLERAREHLAEFRQVQPEVTLADIRRAQPTRAGRMTATLEGLAAAGLPAA